MLLVMDTTEDALWHRWVVGREMPARQALLQAHLSWARLVAKDVYLKVRLHEAEWADYVQNATVGLLEAIDRFQPNRGVDFRTYARHRVRGAVFNGLRHLAATPQAERPHASAGDRSASLAAEDSDPFDAFVSWTIGIGIGQLLESASLADDQQASAPGPYANAVRDQLKDALQRAMDNLPEREWLILTMHYFQHVPFVDIAAQMQLTKGRISQLHRQAMERLRLDMRGWSGSG